ncbi:MAG: helix-turn-helix transcriptional regulator [Oscillospiraceae bacterium]|nr:helix-turn-helix transcriptional regulator [Oscillospiraceae bacterium]
MEVDYTVFRNNLKWLIDSRGLTIKGLAADMGITASTLTRYIHGYRIPELSYIIALSRYFNVSIDWLVGVTTDKYNGLPDEVKEVADLYQVSSDSDRLVINAVLDKYRKGAPK